MGQPIPVDDGEVVKDVPFISPVFNRIFNPAGLDPFYKKLNALKKSGKGVIRIVHIGDSHTQAGSFTDPVREQLQQFFGNAGRGLVFPYQLAKSNAPNDVSSSSNNTWEFNRVAHPEIPIESGVSGYGIKTNYPVASINLSLDSSVFNTMKFFFEYKLNSSWILHTDSSDVPQMIIASPDSGELVKEVFLDHYASGFKLQSLPSPATKYFYGVSLEKSDPGIIYHTIGVNGAKYDSYNKASLFWQQLAALDADLFIVSLGTNEAQKPDFKESEFITQLSNFIDKIKKANPSASILITTTPDSYYRKRNFNPILRRVNVVLQQQCEKMRIPTWDLFRISNGMGSAYNWAKRGLMNTDLVHYISKGYNLQGQLLFNALAKGYNDYISYHKE